MILTEHSDTHISWAQTTSVLKAFFLAMALHPHVVSKAHEELDRVVGNERLPVLSDRENLPYISALIKEVLRWACPVPLGIPKQVMKNEVYNGWLIPAGATIIDNFWYVSSEWKRLGPSTHFGGGRGVTTRRSTRHLTSLTRNGT